MINPEQFFRFGANYFSLLKDIHARGEITDSDLRNLVKRHRQRQPNSPSTNYIVEQLLSLGFLETAPHATASNELTPSVQKILDYLLRAQRLTPFKVLEGYIEALGQLAKDLGAAISSTDASNAVRIMSECHDCIEQIRQYSSDNKESIIRETIFIRSNTNKQSVAERYEIVNRIREKYLVPLRGIIDIHKPIQESLNDLNHLFLEGRKHFKKLGHIALSDEFIKAKARLLRLSVSIRKDFDESGKEIEPLYKTLKKENQIIQGAAKALEIIDRKGVKELGIENLFHITRLPVEGLFSDSRLEGFFHELTNYNPVAPKVIAESLDESIEISFIDPNILKDQIAKCYPLKDSFEWLLNKYPEENINAVLQAYLLVFNEGFGPVKFASEPKESKSHGYRIKYYPLQLTETKDDKRQ